MDWEVWGPPIGVLVVSTVIGGIIAVKMKGEETIDSEGRKAELLAQKKQLLEAIRELDADQSKMDSAVYQQERERLISTASVVLKKLEEDDGKIEKEEVAKGIGFKALASYLTGTMLFFFLVGMLITKYSAPRKEGGVMTGEKSSQATAPQVDWEAIRGERLAKANAILVSDPNNIDALNILTYDALWQRDMNSAMTHMEKVRVQKPDSPDFLVHLAILQLTVGMTERAEIGFNQALEKQEDFAKAKLWKAYMLAAMDKKAEAKALLDSITTEMSWEEETFFLENLKEELNAPPPMITGQVVMLEGEKELEGSTKGTLFIIAQRSAVGGGPPVAVKKINNPQFPLQFELGKKDMVMGGQWPELVFVSARIDLDGNAMTKEDAPKTESVIEIKGTQENVTLALTGFSGTAEKSEAASVTLSGTISLQEGVEVSNGTLFIIAKRASGGGPPVAVKKIENPTFPLQFALGAKDMMMGGEWPEAVVLSARIDLDGNAMTKEDAPKTKEDLTITGEQKGIGLILGEN